MTSTIAAPRPASQSVASAARDTFKGTPGRLRLAGIATVGACLVFGLFAFIAATSRANALSSARADAAQLVRVQTIRTNLVYADANLTNAFLVGGLEPPSARAAYEQGINTALRTLADASGENAQDAAELAGVNSVLGRYTGLVESARANNRLGYPLGAAYLRQATNLLRTDAMPPLADLGATQQQRVDEDFASSAHAMIWLVVGFVAALVVLLVVQGWLSLRTRRTFNRPLLLATAAVLVVGVALAGVMAWSQAKAKDIRSGAYFATVELATARIDAFDAKSAESLTLIARGQGQAYEARFVSLANNVTAILVDSANRGGANEAAAKNAFDKYQTMHRLIREEDNSGHWDQAVSLVTNNESDSNASFNMFDQTSRNLLEQRSAQVRNDLGTAGDLLMPLAWVALMTGIGAAVAAGLGIISRLREYR
jgi:hypothetical protein